MRTGESELSNAALRTRLLETLRTDSEFEMFCLDYFPATQRQFSSGMDRTAKINLLLLCEPAEQISAKLDGLRGRSARAPGLNNPPAKPALSARCSTWLVWMAWAMGATVLLGLGAGAVTAIQRWQRTRFAGSPRVLYGYILDIRTEQPVMDATVSVPEQPGVNSEEGVARSDSRGFFVLETVRPIREGEKIVIHSPFCTEARREVSFAGVISQNPWGQRVPMLQWPTLLFRVDCHGTP